MPLLLYFNAPAVDPVCSLKRPMIAGIPLYTENSVEPLGNASKKAAFTPLSI